MQLNASYCRVLCIADYSVYRPVVSEENPRKSAVIRSLLQSAGSENKTDRYGYSIQKKQLEAAAPPHGSRAIT